MGKIHPTLPANSFHGNLSPEGWEQMNKSRGGLDIIGKSGIPISLSYQSIDLELWPWLRIADNYPSIERVGSTHGHALLPFCSPEMQKWENENGIKGSVPVSFFSEFYAPEDSRIPTQFFFVLEGQTCLYSLYESPCGSSDVEAEKFPENALGIRYGSKVGIIMRDRLFSPLLQAFLSFQRYASVQEQRAFKTPLSKLLDEIEKVGDMSEDTLVVLPIDLEAPFIGSSFGAEVWEVFFDGIRSRGLAGVFTPIGAMLDRIAEKSVKSKRPHRMVTKWATYETQIKHLMSMAQINPVTQREKLLYSIASASDILAAWERKIGESKRAIVLDGEDKNGTPIGLPISYSQPVIDVQLAAKFAITDKDTFQRRLDFIPDKSLFLERVRQYAKKYDL